MPKRDNYIWLTATANPNADGFRRVTVPGACAAPTLDNKLEMAVADAVRTSLEAEKSMVITVARYEELLKAEKILNALRRGGVDNWEWYGDAMDILEDGNGE